MNRTSPETIKRYIDRTFRTGNLNTERLLQLVEHFDSNWTARLTEIIDDRAKAAIDSVLDTRNKFAHGDDYGISYLTLAVYYSAIKSVIIDLDRLANP